MLYCAFDFFPHSRNARWQTCGCPLRAIDIRQSLCHFRFARTPRRVRAFAPHARNVRRFVRASHDLSGMVGTRNARGITPVHNGAKPILEGLAHFAYKSVLAPLAKKEPKTHFHFFCISVEIRIMTLPHRDVRKIKSAKDGLLTL
jgi:hypothetical protein